MASDSTRTTRAARWSTHNRLSIFATLVTVPSVACWSTSTMSVGIHDGSWGVRSSAAFCITRASCASVSMLNPSAHRLSVPKALNSAARMASAMISYMVLWFVTVTESVPFLLLAAISTAVDFPPPRGPIATV